MTTRPPASTSAIDRIPPLVSKPPARTVVAVFAFEGIHPFLMTFPMRIFREARVVVPEARIEVEIFAVAPGRIGLDSVSALELDVTHGLETLDYADIVVIPSWVAPGAEAPPALLAGLRRAHARGATIVGLCLGVFVLAQTGLLDGKAATTMAAFTDVFRQRFPCVYLHPDVLYVHAGNVMTSAGRAAALDCCLALVADAWGVQAADQIADSIVSGPIRFGSHAQATLRRIPVPATDRRVLQVMDWAKSNLREPHTVVTLASRSNMSPRTFIRHFHRLVETTPKQWLLAERTKYAQALLENSELTVEAIATATGFATTAALRKQFKSTHTRSPRDYRQAFKAGEGLPDVR